MGDDDSPPSQSFNPIIKFGYMAPLLFSLLCIQNKLNSKIFVYFLKQEIMNIS